MSRILAALLAATGLTLAAYDPAAAQTPAPAAPPIAGHARHHPAPKDDAACDTCDGVRLLQQGQFDRALHIFQLLAAKGDDVATSNLGFMYQHGLGVPVDYDKAHELYWQAASHGVPVAANQMGYLYQYGLGVPQNLTTAYCWYEFAEVNGYEDSLRHLGELSVQGVALKPGAAECEVVNHP